MREKLQTLGAVVAGGTLAFCLVLGFDVAAVKIKATNPPAAPATACPEPDDSWVMRRLEACDKVCGPVPFEVHATRDSINCVCGRPDRVRVLRLPRPGAGG